MVLTHIHNLDFTQMKFHLAVTNQTGCLLDENLRVHRVVILEVQHGNFDALEKLIIRI